MRCVRTAGVRSGDSLHLAAATIAFGFEPTAVRFLTEDVRLRAAAERGIPRGVNQEYKYSS